MKPYFPHSQIISYVLCVEILTEFEVQLLANGHLTPTELLAFDTCILLFDFNTILL